MGLSVWRETSKKLAVCRELCVHREIAKFLTVYRVCYTPIDTLILSLFSESIIVIKLFELCVLLKYVFLFKPLNIYCCAVMII